jgi:hypothetical protein
MVQLVINNQKIELPTNSKIKFTKQIADIFDLANVSVSFSNSFEFEKTPKNTQAMNQLGISGDNSNVPYSKNIAKFGVNGFDIVSNGWFNISNTDSKYKGSILDGMVDFFKAIENKTMGNDLDLQNFNHEKTLATVVDSFTVGNYYQYIVADYGGKVLFENGINIDYLSPCFSVKKLWELIFSTFGFNCDYTNLSYLEGLYITYPKEISQGQVNEIVATLVRSFFGSQDIVNFSGNAYWGNALRTWNTSTIIEGSLIDNWKYVIPETTSYNFDLTSEMYVIYRYPSRANRNTNPRVDVLKNGVIIGSILSDFITDVPGVGDPRNLIFNLQCDAGDVIEMSVSSPSNLIINGNPYRAYEWRHNNTNFVISKTDLGTTILENELKDFLIKDFIKEQTWRTGLTPILNKQTNTVEFITLDSRLDFQNAQDYSHTFVERTDEIYTNDYAQKNIFKLKNNVDTDNQGDGYLYVPNRNIEDQKIIATSKIFAPDKKIVTNFINGVSTNQYRIWEAEPIDDNGVMAINYKGLSGRFYFIRKQEQSGSFKIISEILNDETVATIIPVGINTNTLFEEAVYNNYAEYQKILINFRIHYISLAMSENDFIGLDLTKPVFFKQENAYYICNKISFSEGEKSTGEFIKINKV